MVNLPNKAVGTWVRPAPECLQDIGCLNNSFNAMNYIKIRILNYYNN